MSQRASNIGGQESLTALLGGKPDDVPTQTADASPITWVDARTAPILLLHGAADHMVLRWTVGLAFIAVIATNTHHSVVL